jgi:hypothetical protein
MKAAVRLRVAFIREVLPRKQSPCRYRYPFTRETGTAISAAVAWPRNDGRQ